MNRIVLRSLLALLITACLDAPTAPTTQEVPYNPSFAVLESTHFFEVTPEAGLFVHNECSGEDVHLIEGKFQFVLSETLNKNGSHGHLHQVSAGVRGVGVTTGQEYLYKQIDRASGNVQIPGGTGQQTFTISMDARFITRGSGEDATFTFLISITVNGNGEVTQFKFDAGTITCR